MKIGFDNQKYIELQSENIRKRINQFGGKLYLEFGGKLRDDYHASRVLPGFEPDVKVRMLHGQIGIMAVRPVFSGVADDVFAGEEKLIQLCCKYRHLQHRVLLCCCVRIIEL